MMDPKLRGRILEVSQLLHRKRTFAAMKLDNVKHESDLFKGFIAIIFPDVYTTLQQYLRKEWECVTECCAIKWSLF